MITKIIDALETYPNVKPIKFGSQAPPETPYVVVKQENDLGGRGTAFRIIAHFMPGQQIFLEDYIRGTVGDILDDFSATDRNGNNNKLLYDSEDNLPELTIDNSDGTISMERVYFMPDRFF